jgi:hypothetical protein
MASTASPNAAAHAAVRRRTPRARGTLVTLAAVLMEEKATVTRAGLVDSLMIEKY